MRALDARAARVYETGPRTPLTKFFRTIGRAVVPVQKHYLGRSFEEVLAAQAVPGDADQGRARMPAVFRWYLSDCVRRACAGGQGERLNFQRS